MDLSAIALGPNNVLATAGNTAGGVAIRIWDLDSPAVPRSLPPPAQSYTRLMRFSPQGNLLALMGSGPIELWDPVALNRVAVVTMSDQATDVVFGPNGATLAAVGRAGEAWCGRCTIRRREPSSAGSIRRRYRWRSATPSCWPGWTRTVRTGRGGAAGARRSGLRRRIPRRRLPPRRLRCPSRNTSRRRAPTALGGGDDRARKDRGRADGGRWASHPRLSFDSSGRLVFLDAQGLRVYDAATRSVQSPPAFSIPSAAMQGSVPFRMMTSAWRGAVTAERSRSSARSSIYLWHAETPGEITHVELPGAVRECAAVSAFGRRSAPAGARWQRGFQPCIPDRSRSRHFVTGFTRPSSGSAGGRPCCGSGRSSQAQDATRRTAARASGSHSVGRIEQDCTFA